MYNNPYMANINQQNFNDRIDNEIERLKQMKTQIQQPIQHPTNLTQNFQIAPTNQGGIKYANSIDEVQRDMTIIDTSYFSKDMSVVWIKNAKGEIRTYELNEIKPMDEKDIKIQYLEEQIEELKKEVKKNEHNANVDPRFDEQDTTKDDESNGDAIKNEKSTSIQRVSTSKKK